jgi:hypothetical protein
MLYLDILGTFFGYPFHDSVFRPDERVLRESGEEGDRKH